jgi:hypothetical protein
VNLPGILQHALARRDITFFSHHGDMKVYPHGWKPLMLFTASFADWDSGGVVHMRGSASKMPPEYDTAPANHLSLAFQLRHTVRIGLQDVGILTSLFSHPQNCTHSLMIRRLSGMCVSKNP